jgi:glycerate 2-kinase
VLSAGSDGVDGNSPAAGAVADSRTAERAAALGRSVEGALADFDSYNFFSALGDTLITGPTGNNLRDLRILLVAS